MELRAGAQIFTGEREMIIIEMNGGLGNQLQQYALYEKFKSLQKEVKLDISWYETDSVEERKNQAVTRRKLELDYFPGVSYEVCTREEKQGLLGSNSFFFRAMRRLGWTEAVRYVEHQMYDENIFALDNKVLSGYWACEAYYRDILQTLKKRLTFPSSGNPQNEAMKKKMEETNSVSIHLRRGDYLTEENRKMFGGICTDAYYESALKYIREREDKIQFFIFSDDSEYADKYFSPFLEKGYTIVDCNHGEDSFYDIELMSCCKHNICANSTFSFWGARLNHNPGRIAIRPLKQKNGVDWYQPEMMKKLWKNWIFIDEKGSVQ